MKHRNDWTILAQTWTVQCHAAAQRRRPRGACLAQALSPDLAPLRTPDRCAASAKRTLLVGSAGRCVRRGEAGRRGERCVVGGGAGDGAGAAEGSPPPSWCSVGACLAGLRPPPPSPAWGRRHESQWEATLRLQADALGCASGKDACSSVW